MKPILFFLAFLLLASPSFSQNKRRTQESNRVYMELGPGLIWFSGEMAPGMEGNDLRPHFGLGLTRPFNGPIYTHTGLYAARKGSRSVEQSVVFNGQTYAQATLRSALDYLIVPYLIRVELGDRIRWYAEGGAYGGFLVQAALTVTGNLPLASQDVLPQYKRYDAGFAVGSGLQATFMDNFAVTVGGRYSQGLINISNDPLAQGLETYNNALVLRIGIGVWLGSGLK